MDSFTNITLGVFPKVHFRALPSKGYNETANYVNSQLEKHNLANTLRMERIDETPFSDFTLFVNKKYNSSCEFFVVQSEHHSLVVCISSIDFKYLENGIHAICLEHAQNFEKVSLAEKTPGWAFSCAVVKIDSPNEELQDVFRKLSMSKDEFARSGVSPAFYGCWNWNAGIIIVEKPVRVEKILYCFIIQAAKWENTEMSHREAITLMGKLLKSNEREAITNEQKLLELYSMYIHFNTVTEKNLVSYDQEDIFLHDLIEEGWKYSKLRQQVNDLFVDIDKLVSFSNGIALKKGSYKTNKFLAYIGIIGFSGTVAALISTIDFSNSILSTEVARSILIFLLTLVLVVFFSMLNAVRKPLREPRRKRTESLTNVPASVRDMSASNTGR